MSQGAETQRARRARLANLRQELLAPVSTILGFAEMLHQDAARNGPEEAVADLARILTAARDLHAMVDRLLDKELAETLFEGADEAAAQQKLRHDLRTPINAIKGYGEMLLEDLEDLGAGRHAGGFRHPARPGRPIAVSDRYHRRLLARRFRHGGRAATRTPGPRTLAARPRRPRCSPV